MLERHRSTSLRVVAAMVFAASPLSAATVATAAGADESSPGALLGSTVFETRGHVVSVDPATNSVTLSGERGTRFTFEVEPEVADVSRLAPGDQVDVTYRHAPHGAAM